MEVGSPEWARSTVEYAKSLWHSKENTEARWRAAVEELAQGKAWEALGKPDLDSLLVEAIGKDARESIKALQRQGAPKGSRNAAKDRIEAEIKGDVITFNSRGTARDYILARLQRDGHAELLAAVAAGETSAHAAAQQVGYRKKVTSLDQLQRAWMKANSEERRIFLAWAEALSR